MWSTPSLPLLPGPLCPEVEAADNVLSMVQIELCPTSLFRMSFIFSRFKSRVNDLYEIDLLEIEQFDHLTVFK